jgi:phosphoribosylaminoimidazole-succinocarboxamide synthase
VKNVRGDKGQPFFIFEYTDKYSVFDWGEMPDHLSEKGEALVCMADLFFKDFEDPKSWSSLEGISSEMKERATWKELTKKGLKHHSQGPVDKDLKPLERGSRARYLKVQPVKIIKPRERLIEGKTFWDYSQYVERQENCLIPLEVIFRFGAPKGSSLIKRAAKRPDYAQEIGLDHAPVEGDEFEQPIIEFSTKLESVDRFINYSDAKRIAGLTDVEFQDLQDRSFLIAMRLKEIFGKCGLKLWDGKVEFAFGEKNAAGNREVILVDSIGPDELRLTHKGVQLSKEILRQFYVKGSWYEAVQKSKKMADEEGSSQWKNICQERLGQRPPLLDKELKEICEDVYRVLANTLAKNFGENKVFGETYTIDEIVAKVEAKNEQ